MNEPVAPSGELTDAEPVLYRYKFKEDLQWQYTTNPAQAHRLAVVEPLYAMPPSTSKLNNNS